MAENKCPICNANATVNNYDHNHIYVECENCGKYYLKLKGYDWIKNNDKLATYMYYNCKVPSYDESNKEFFAMFTDEVIFDTYKSQFKHCIRVTKESAEAWYPRTFNEKVDLFLLMLYKRTNFLGETVLFTDKQKLTSTFSSSNLAGPMKNVADVNQQVKLFASYLYQEKYIHRHTGGYELLVDGLKRVDELQKNQSNNKNVFVSMAFNDSTKETREAIRQGIINAGYSAKFIDEIIHNKQIVPEMFRLIRECRFLILDISDPNYGAYYEAGYALGLGKEVIICCNQDAFSGNIKIDGSAITDEEKEKFGKYLRPHFDIAQKQILVWTDYADLTKKLEEWIKAII